MGGVGMSPTGRLNVYIPKELHTEVKVFAAKNDQSASSIVERALREFLEREEKARQH
jgi:predicted transcriptional regulator